VIFHLISSPVIRGRVGRRMATEVLFEISDLKFERPRLRLAASCILPRRRGRKRRKS
jgi:hypothetical protein